MFQTSNMYHPLLKAIPYDGGQNINSYIYNAGLLTNLTAENNFH